MFEFTIYGVDNDKFRMLLSELNTALNAMPLPYKVNQVKDIDEIIKSGVISIPSIYFKDTLIIEDHIPNDAVLKQLIFKALEMELDADQLSSLKTR